MEHCPWEQLYDPNYQRNYFHNNLSGETFWEDPRPQWLCDERTLLQRQMSLASVPSLDADTATNLLSDRLGRSSLNSGRNLSKKRVSLAAGPRASFTDIDDTSMSLEEGEELNQSSLINSLRQFRVRVVGCDNVYEGNHGGFERFRAKFEDASNIRLYIEVALCFGGEEICAPQRTPPTSICSSPRWCEWLTFGIGLGDLPVGARLCSTLWAEVGEKHTPVPLAWVNMALMDRQHNLHQGVISQRMFPDDSANPLGTTAENYTDPGASLVFFDFDVYSVPLRFPSREDQIQLGREIREEPDLAALEVANLDDKAQKMLKQSLMKHPLEALTTDEKQLLWRARNGLTKESKALPKFLRSVQWANRKAVAETYVLLEEWQPSAPLDALELLSVKFADPEVRRYAIECLEGRGDMVGLSDSEVIELLPQLVQVLKSEPHLDSHLSRFLLGRGLKNPFKVGHILFWQLKAEMHVPETSQRFGLLLEEFAKALSPVYRQNLLTECDVLEKLLQISIDVTEVEKDKRNEVARERLRELSLPDHFIMPLDSKWAASGLVIEKCRAMDSKKVPLWLTFKNADPEGAPLVTMLKYGDDLRQDIVTLQMIRIMDKLWEQSGLELRLNTYGVSATGDNEGMLEIVLDSITYAGITEKAGGASEMFNKARVADWLRQKNPTEQSYSEAVDNFIHSAAGYCVATYVLGIGDRHDDNIMLTMKGHLFHIDFGHFLGHFKDFKKIPGVKIRRERTPFVFTPDWAYVMGGLKADGFKKFADICCEAYLIIRRHASLFINMFAMMLSTGIPELTDESDIQYMIDVLMLDKPDDEATKNLRKLIIDSHNNRFKQIDGVFHILAHK